MTEDANHRYQNPLNKTLPSINKCGGTKKEDFSDDKEKETRIRKTRRTKRDEGMIIKICNTVIRKVPY